MNRSGYLRSVRQGDGMQRWHKHHQCSDKEGPSSRHFQPLSYAYRHHQPIGADVHRSSLHAFTHWNIITCTEYAYRKPGSATFRHLRINVVISSALGNSLLTASYALFFQLTVLVEVLSACCAYQSKPIYEYFSTENRVYNKIK